MKKILALALALCMVFTLCACGKSAGSDLPGITADKTIKIGFVGFLSGGDAYLGQGAKMALEDYIEELNADGGILGMKVELVPYDIGMDPNTETANACNRLIQQDKVVAVIGPESTEQAMVAVPIMNEGKVPMIVTTASNPLVTVAEDGSLNPYMFRMCFTDPYQGTALANFAYNDLGLRNTAFLGDVTNIYCEGIQNCYRDEFTKIGGTVATEEGMMATDVDFRAQLTTIAESGADSILLATGSYKVVSFVAKQARQLGLDDITLLGVDGWYANELLDLAGAELEGSYMTNMVSDDDPMFAEYIEKFTAKHPGTTPNVYAYYALDAMMSIEWAIKEAGVANSSAIAEKLGTMKDVPVFTGNLTIESDTHNPHNKTVSIIEITDGQFKTYKLYTPED